MAHNHCLATCSLYSVPAHRTWPRAESPGERSVTVSKTSGKDAFQHDSLEGLLIQRKTCFILRRAYSILALDRCFEQSLDVNSSLEKLKVLAHKCSVCSALRFQHLFLLRSVFLTWLATSRRRILMPHVKMVKVHQPWD